MVLSAKVSFEQEQRMRWKWVKVRKRELYESSTTETVVGLKFELVIIGSSAWLEWTGRGVTYQGARKRGSLRQWRSGPRRAFRNGVAGVVFLHAYGVSA